MKEFKSNIYFKPKRLHPESDEIKAVMALLIESFAYMEGRIDPPSSLNTFTLETIRDHCKSEEVWICASPPLACMFLTRKEDCLYLGKLAISQPHRKKGLARCLIKHAETRAEAHGCKKLKLQTRVELIENHCFFEHLGFVKTAETRHDGYTRTTSITMVKTIMSKGKP